MTREMIKQVENDYWKEKADPIDMAEVFDLANKALEQEPVIDKIRAEIENDWQLKKYPSSPFSCGLRRAIEIIDKHKEESEG